MFSPSIPLATARRILHYLRPHLTPLVLAAATMLVVTGLHLARPLILRELIDTTLPRRDVGQALRLGLLFVAALGLGALAIYARAMLLARVGTAVMARLKEEVFAHLLALPMRFFDQNAPGHLISRAENDIEQMRGLLSGAAAQLGASTLLLFAVTGLIWHQAPDLGPWLLALLTVATSILIVYTRFIRGIYRTSREQDADMAAHLTECVQGVSLLRLFGKEEAAVTRVMAATRARCATENRAAFYDTVVFYGGFAIATDIGIMAAMLWYGTGEVFAGRMTLGTLVMFLELLRRFFGPLRDMAEVLIQLQSGLAATGRVFALLETPTEPSFANPVAGQSQSSNQTRDLRPSLDLNTSLSLSSSWSSSLPQGSGPIQRQDGNPVPQAGSFAVAGGKNGESAAVWRPSPGCPAGARTRRRFQEIAFQDVTFAYEEEPVLQNVSFTIRRGQHVAIVGSSGSGKSTCINLLLRFYDPTTGAILVDGHDLRGLPTTPWRERIALVLQEIHLFPGTILDNLRAFDPAVSAERVRAAAQALGADRFIRRLPDGYATVLTERGSNLSLGERQLLCYTRAMVRNPDLLILDEATSAVDALTEHRLQVAMARLMAGRTAIIIAHRLTTITAANRILVFAGGRLVESGTHLDLLRQRGIYRHLASLQGLDRLPGRRRPRAAGRSQRTRARRFPAPACSPERRIPSPC